MGEYRRVKYHGVYRYGRDINAVRYDRWKHRHPGVGFVQVKWWEAAFDEKIKQGDVVLDGEIGRIERVRFIEV